jgi:hypothetical protein
VAQFVECLQRFVVVNACVFHPAVSCNSACSGPTAG